MLSALKAAELLNVIHSRTSVLYNLGVLFLPIGCETLNAYPVAEPKIELKVASAIENSTVRKGN